MAQYQPMYDSFNRMPERYVPTARIGVSPNVRLPGGDMDMYTGQLKPDHVRRHRTQAANLEKAEKDRQELREMRKKDAMEREIQKGGVRIEIWKGMLLIAALLFICGVSLLWQQGLIVACQKEINSKEKIIAQYREENAVLEEQIAAASDPAVICYAASRDLNMIPAESAKAIELVAVDTRPLETARRQKQMAAAQTETAQSTPIPMTASN